MITRLLPRNEWASALVGTELEAAVAYLPVEGHVIVVQDGDTVIGCWAVLPYWHCEGLWIHPEHRRKASVGRRLLSAMRHVAAAKGARVVLTAALDATVRNLIAQVGGKELPGTHHVIPIGGK